MNKKQRILEIIDTLALPISQKEAEESLDKLSDREMDLLIPLYEELVALHHIIDDVARQSDPEEYERLQKEYQQKLADLSKSYEEDKAQADFTYQSELADAELEVKTKRDEVLKELEEGIEELEEVSND